LFGFSWRDAMPRQMGNVSNVPIKLLFIGQSSFRNYSVDTKNPDRQISVKFKGSAFLTAYADQTSVDLELF
jgi:hypothetical protein